MRTCELPGVDCDGKHYGHGLCLKHWARARRSGQLVNEVRCDKCGAWWDRDAPDTPAFVLAHLSACCCEVCRS